MSIIKFLIAALAVAPLTLSNSYEQGAFIVSSALTAAIAVGARPPWLFGATVLVAAWWLAPAPATCAGRCRIPCNHSHHTARGSPATRCGWAEPSSSNGAVSHGHDRQPNCNSRSLLRRGDGVPLSVRQPMQVLFKLTNT